MVLDSTLGASCALIVAMTYRRNLGRSSMIPLLVISILGGVWAMLMAMRPMLLSLCVESNGGMRVVYCCHDVKYESNPNHRLMSAGRMTRWHRTSRPSSCYANFHASQHLMNECIAWRTTDKTHYGACTTSEHYSSPWPRPSYSSCVERS